MRINAFVARATGIGRRRADTYIASGRVTINKRTARLGDDTEPNSHVALDGKTLTLPANVTTIILNKPAGYVVSRRGQGAKTIYQLLPAEYRDLKPVGRLDKDSSGLLLMTNDGQLAQKLAHPGHETIKVYRVKLNLALSSEAQSSIQAGIRLKDGPSRLDLRPEPASRKSWVILMHEGRKRQIRRTFQALGYEVVSLHRESIGPYKLGSLTAGSFRQVFPKQTRTIK